MRGKQKFLIFYFFVFIFSLFLVGFAYAHCPLCTAGAAVAAGTAAYFGVNTSIIGLFIGAFAVSLGFWMARLLVNKIKNKLNKSNERLIKFMKISIFFVLILFSFIITIFPIKPIIASESFALNIWLTGSYGSLLNRTYLIDKFLFGSIIGGIIIVISPLLSKGLTNLRRGKTFPYQGLTLTFLLLIIAAILMQILI